MDKHLEAKLEKTYGLIKKSFSHSRIDSLDVVKQVEEYRQFWKPEKVKVVLLAESHVYTDESDFASRLNMPFLNRIIPNYSPSSNQLA